MTALPITLSQAQVEIERLRARLALADELVSVCRDVDAYLTKLQTPGSEPLNSVNGSKLSSERSHFTAKVRNQAREQWAALGNALQAYDLTGKEPTQ